MSDLFLRPLFTWRSMLASEFGPSNPTTRHVLLTLSLHMTEAGESCFPSIDLLTTQTGLSRRAVVAHLSLAERDGWIGKRDRRKPNSQGWRRIEYFPLIPHEASEGFHAKQAGARDAPAKGSAHGALASNDSSQVADCNSETSLILEAGAPNAPARPGAPDSERGAPGSKGGASGAPEYFSSSSRNTSKGKPAALRRPLPPDFAISDQIRTWAKEQRPDLTPYLEAHLAYFVDYARASNARYFDFDAAFRNCIRADWGGVRKAMRLNEGRSLVSPIKASQKCTSCSEDGPYKLSDKPYCAFHYSEANRVVLERERLDERALDPRYRRMFAEVAGKVRA